MATVEALLKMPGLCNLNIIAGHAGLDREIKSVSIMDAPDSYKWLKGGEFILTTGFMLGGDDWQLEHFLENLIDAQCSAIGIKRGRFLNAIPETVIKLAEQNHFPVIEIPYVFGWSEIISVFYAMQYGSQTEGIPDVPAPSEAQGHPLPPVDDDGFYSDFLSKLLCGNVTAGCIRDFESHQASDRDAGYCILLAGSTDRETVLNNIRFILDNPRLTRNGKAFVRAAHTDTGGRTVVLLDVCLDSDAQADEWQYLLAEELDYFVGETEAVNLSMGRICRDAVGISLSYTQAQQAYDLGSKVWKDKRCWFYPMLAVYGALKDSDMSEIGLDYVNTLVRCRDKLDFDSLENLEAYIECGYKKAASKLAIHENTLRYRVQKIADLLHLELSDSAVCNILLTQIKLWKIIR